MKKLITMACVLVMVLSLTVTAYAATEPAAVAVGVNDVAENLFVAQEVEVASNVTMQIPKRFTSKTVDNVTTMTDGVHTIKVVVYAAGEGEYASLADAKKAFIDAGLQKSLVEMKINGVPALGVIAADGTYKVLIQAPDGSMIVLEYPDFNTADDEYKAWIANMVKSIVIK